MKLIILDNPFFLPMFGSMAYIVLLVFSLIATLPLLIFKKTRLTAKVIFWAAFISFPTLVLVGGILFVLFVAIAGSTHFILSFFGISELWEYMGFFAIIFFLIAGILVLYHWYLGIIMIRNILTSEPFDRGIENNWMYSVFLKKIVNNYYKRKQITNKL